MCWFLHVASAGNTDAESNGSHICEGEHPFTKCFVKCRYADMQNWKSAVVEWSPGEDGGYKEVVLEIQGESVYSKLKYEAGVLSSAPPLSNIEPCQLIARY
jgi:protein subunit release factor B